MTPVHHMVIYDFVHTHIAFAMCLFAHFFEVFVGFGKTFFKSLFCGR
jgi:hypothetical protein